MVAATEKMINYDHPNHGVSFMSQKVYEVVTRKITEKLEAGVIPWKRPWSGSMANLGTHKNAVTGKTYRGVNAILTHLAGYDSPKWMTFRQAKSKGYNIKKGEKGMPVLFWNWTKKEDEQDDDSKSYQAFIRYYTVFNAQQIEGMENEITEYKDILEFNPIDQAEKIIKGFTDAPTIKQKFQRAYYDRINDYVNLPKETSFNSIEEYYSTLFHELGHSTGHISRLNRKSLNAINNFGDHSYSKEELVAELSAAFLCSFAGIGPTVIDNQAAYIDGWLGRLKKDPRLFVQAAQQAQKAVDYITGNKFKGGQNEK